jgi:protein-tyrosine phosphatase
MLALLAAVLGLAGCAGPGAAPPGDPAAIPFTDASVAQTAPTAFTVSWNGPAGGPVTIYTGSDRDHIDRTRAVARGGPSGTVELKDLGPVDRRWFELMPRYGRPLELADRSLHLVGAPNFRDLGGYRTVDGRWVRMGSIYRSDQLDRLTDADLAKLTRLGIRTVVDLRTDAERATGPDRLPAGATAVVADVLDGTAMNVNMSALLASPADPVATMRSAEQIMVEAPGAQAAYRTLLVRITQPTQLPLVVHCTAGKDRTGWASATVLTALGVPAGTVMHDYLESNRYVLAKYAPLLHSLPPDRAAHARPMLEVRPDYLQAGLDDATARYGSMDDYVTRILGTTPAALRAQLLQD